MRWEGHAEQKDDPNGHAQLIRLTERDSCRSVLTAS